MVWLGLGDIASAQPPIAAHAQPVVQKLRSVIQYEMQAKDLPAFSIALVDGDTIVWAEGFGFADVGKKVPATAQTVYRVGSISKLLTAVAVMQLVERGELDLEAPITQYLPEFTPRNPYNVPITLRHLLSHRSGIVRESPVGNYVDSSEPSLQATVKSLNDTSLVYVPGTTMKYSNAAVAVVGYLLEKQTGKPFAEQVKQSVFEPLGMANSEFLKTAQMEARMAEGWMWTYDGRRFLAPRFQLGTAPAGNLYSSVMDLAKFMLAIFNDGRGERGSILAPETIHSMLKSHSKPGQPGFGLGFQVGEVDGRRKMGHGGAVYGFASQFVALPDEKLGVIAVTSLDAGNAVVDRIADYALQLMLVNRQAEPLPEYEKSSPIPTERANQMPGRFQLGDQVLEVTELNGRVRLLGKTFQREVRARASDGTPILDDIFGYGPTVQFEDDALTLGDERYGRVADDQPPAEVPDHWKGLIGEYGWDHSTLYILEDHGRLVALIEWIYYYPLEDLGNDVFAFPDYGLYHDEKLKFTRDANGDATQVVAAEISFPRRNVGTKAGETFKIQPVKPIDELREAALAAEPPKEDRTFRPSDLVELTSLDPSIRLDIRYASTNNFTGAVFYQQPNAFLQRPAAEAVVRVHRRLKEKGLGLLIHDAYRPWHVTKMFWDATPAEMKQFVANPARGSRHNRGCAVDLTLCDLQTGQPIEMVAGYDEFSPRSFPTYPGGTSRQRWYRELLRRAMEAEGFTVYEFEWWHFDYKDWQQYGIENRTFESLP